MFKKPKGSDAPVKLAPTLQFAVASKKLEERIAAARAELDRLGIQQEPLIVSRDDR